MRVRETRKLDGNVPKVTKMLNEKKEYEKQSACIGLVSKSA